MSISIQQCGDVQVETNNGHVKLKGKVKSVKINGNEVLESKVQSFNRMWDKFVYGFVFGVTVSYLAHLFNVYMAG